MTNDDQSWRGKIGALSLEELDAFLAEGVIARVASLDERGWPYVVPCWHEWNGNSFFLCVREKARWARYLANDPRCAITVDEAGGQRKVVAQCTAVVVEEPNVGGEWVGVAERTSVRYLGENGPSYLVPTLDSPRWLFRLDIEEMQTWQGNDWAAKYKS